MTTISLDAVVRNFLLKRQYTLHWYLQFIVYAKDCLRQLNEDDLLCINTKLLPVNDYNAVDLPSDYLDYTLVGVKVGQNVKPLVETNKINRMINRNSDLEPIKYSESESNPNNEVNYGALYPFYWHTVYWNSYGEPTGRMFGAGAGVQDDVFSVFPERNQIQLTENMTVDNIVLEYISDGMNADAATRITPYAYDTIDAYIMYQMKCNTRTYSAGEAEYAKQDYIDQRKILRARMNPMTIEMWKRLFQRATYASPKSL